MDPAKLCQAAADRRSCSFGQHEPRITSSAVQSCDRYESAPISEADSSTGGTTHHGVRERRCGLGWLRSRLWIALPIQSRVSQNVWNPAATAYKAGEITRSE